MSQFSVFMRKSPDRSSAIQPLGTDPNYRRLKLDGNTLSLTGQGFELLAETERREIDRVWLEPRDRPGQEQSFVVIFGWCYRTSSDSPVLSDGDCRAILQSHRRHEVIDLDDFSGNYCVLSYDHLGDTLWCCSDLWAQQSLYFGANRELVSAGSRASWVADRLCASVDGYSYLTMLRGASVVPGRTLYAGVHRLTCGLGLKLDLGKCGAILARTGNIWKSPLDISFAEAVELAIETITRVCLRAACLPHTAVDLTGGNDSRLTAAALSSAKGAEIGRRVTFKVHAVEGHPDAVTARRIAGEFNWTLRRYDRPAKVEVTDETIDFLREVAVLSDGERLPCALAMGLSNERTHWSEYAHLVGSVSGELFRDRYWYQETLNMGRTEKVDYDAFWHTLSASADADFERVTRGVVKRQDHDAYLKSCYRLLETGAPSLLNVYKLDRLAVHKMLSTNNHWRYSALRATHHPYHTKDATDVAMRLPWRYRVGRKLVTNVVEKLSPRLARIPTDRGAPMRPLRISNAGSYLRYHVWDTADRWNRHFGPGRRQRRAGHLDCSMPALWSQYIENARRDGILNGTGPTGKRAGIGFPATSPGEFREQQMMLLFAVLRDVYPNLQLRLDFDRPEPLVPLTACQLL